MTVGVAARCDGGEEPKVVVGADRLLTTEQQSAIEHEHPEPKVKVIGENVPTMNCLAITSGRVDWAEELRDKIEQDCDYYINEEEIALGVKNIAEIGAGKYQEFLQEKIDRQILSHFGITLDDLKAQHRFKDRFISDVRLEIENARDTINSQLKLLIGGVDAYGSHVYEVGNGDFTTHNDRGYTAIGSGIQPALSEFMEDEYSGNCTLSRALVTVTASIMRARQASGVGGDIDIGIVGNSFIEMANDDVLRTLKERNRAINEAQERAKQEVLESESVNWNPGT